MCAAALLLWGGVDPISHVAVGEHQHGGLSAAAAGRAQRPPSARRLGSQAHDRAEAAMNPAAVRRVGHAASDFSRPSTCPLAPALAPQ